MLYDNFNADEVNSISERVEANSKVINSVVSEIIEPYCRDLDHYVKFIADILKDGQNPPTAQELDDFVLNLSTYIYFASGMCEQLGIKDDISKAIYREMYNSTRASQSTGTVADKDSFAELASQQEQLTNICYSRAYKTLKAKIESAQELLSSVKKVITRRIQETELTRLTN